MSNDNTPRRVAARFHNGDFEDDFSYLPPEETGIILRPELEQRLGHVGTITSREFDGRVDWRAVSDGGTTVRGTARMESFFLDGRVHLWPRVEIAGAIVPGPARAASGAPKQISEERLEEVATLTRRLMMRIRTQPGVPSVELAADLKKLVELAELG